MLLGIDAGRREHGFTLIELMIVMVVLGILAGIVAFTVGAFRDNATLAACESDIHALATANAGYLSRHGTNAPDIDALISDGFLDAAPTSGLAFTDGETTPATADGCRALTASPTSPPPASSAPTSVAVTNLEGTTLRDDHTDDWTATVTVTVADDLGNGIDSAEVTGVWSDAATPASCTTGPSGACSFTSPHTTPNPSTERTWTVSSVTKAGYAAGTNAVTVVVCRMHGSPGGSRACTTTSPA